MSDQVTDAVETESEDNPAEAVPEEHRDAPNLDVILNIPVELSMEVGRTRVPIKKLLSLSEGSIVELTRLAGEPLDVLVNGTLIAKGEVVVVEERFGIKLTDIISPEERLHSLN